MASVLHSTERRCPSGRHVMDPGWDSCPYCDAEKRSTQQTAYQRPKPVSSSDQQRTTTIADSISSTKAMPQQGSAPKVGGYGGRGQNRRIEGILITYTHRPEGDLFAICTGKNTIGAGNTGLEPGDPPCDIQITDDPTLSSAHALILCRQGKIQITDLNTTNGTILDGEVLPMSGADLPDNATITTGSTVWHFMKIVAPNASKSPLSQEDNKIVQSETPKSSKKDKGTDGKKDTVIPI